MAWRSKKDSADFDAVEAASELDEALGDQESPANEEYIRSLESEVEGLHTLLMQKEELHKRAVAQKEELLEETERIKKRLKLDAEQTIARKIGEMIIELLEVDDNLDRAIAAAQKMDHNPDVVAGIVLVQKAFDHKLEKFGVSHQPALGARFDPAIHEAISMLSVDDPAQDGIILAVAQEGYALHGEILRPARVAVGKLQH